MPNVGAGHRGRGTHGSGLRGYGRRLRSSIPEAGYDRRILVCELSPRKIRIISVSSRLFTVSMFKVQIATLTSEMTNEKPAAQLAVQEQNDE